MLLCSQRASPSPAPRGSPPARHRHALTPKPRLSSLTGAAEHPVAMGQEAPVTLPTLVKPPRPTCGSPHPLLPMEKRALAALPSAQGLPRHAAVHDIIAKTTPTMGPVSAAPLAPSKAHSPLLSSSHRPSGAGPGSSRDTVAPACLCRGRWKRPVPLLNAAVEVQCPRLQSSAFRGRNEWKLGGRGRNRLASPSCLTVQREPESAWDVPTPCRFGMTQQPPHPPGWHS